jgi:arylsulfatase A-like enzyme
LEVDWCVGQVVDALVRKKVADNTLVIFTSDNGAYATPLRLEETFGHKPNADFRGQKSDAWDGGHHIPFIARWPGHVAAGSTCDRTVSLVDLFATCADLVNSPVPTGAAEDSVSMLPLLLGKADAPVRPAVVMHSNDGFFAIKQGPWKLVLAKGSGGWPLPEGKLPADAPPVQLYNTQEDPGEKLNLSGKHPEIVTELTALLDELKKSGRSAGR